MNKLIFLCTGNYYRSRFAEIVFNHLAAQSGLAWQADSRALRPSPNNVGPISAHAVQGLSERGLILSGEIRFPLLAAEEDFETAHRIIAVKEAEHRPLMDELFPAWTERVEFWGIHDIDCAEPREALPLLHDAVVRLHAELLAETGLLAESPVHSRGK